jgi:hypothetical protein
VASNFVSITRVNFFTEFAPARILLFFRVNFVENFIGANIKGLEEKVKVS